MRLDWSPSTNDKFFGRYSFAPTRTSATSSLPALPADAQRSAVLQRRLQLEPGRSGRRWSTRCWSATATRPSSQETVDWAGVGDGNALYGIAGGQPIAGLSPIGWGSGLTLPGAIATDSDTLAKTYQLNEKLTWLQRPPRAQVRRPVPALQPAPFLRRQQRAARLHQLSTARSPGSRSRTSCSTRSRARGAVAATRQSRGRTCRTGSRSSSRTTSRSREPDAESRPALGLHVAAGRERQPTVQLRSRHRRADLRRGRQHRGSRALQAVLQGLRAAARAACGAGEQLGVARRLRHLPVHGGHGREPAAAAQPAVLLRIRRQLRPTPAPGAPGPASPSWCRDDASETFAPTIPTCARSSPTVERVRRVPVTPSHVGAGRLRRAQRRPLVTPVEGNQALPGVGDPATWAAKTTRRPLYRRAAARHHHRDDGRAVGSKYNSMQASLRQRSWTGLEFLASYTLAKGTTNNRGFYGVFGGTGLQGVTSATEGAYWQNTYDPEAEWGPMFHDVRHNLVLLRDLRASIRQGKTDRHRVVRPDRGAARRLESGRHLPGALRPPDHGHGRTRAARCRVSGAPSARTASATEPSISRSTVARHQCVSPRPLGTFGNCPVGVARAPGYTNLDLGSRRGSARRPRYAEFRVEAFNALNHPSFGPPARDISVPNTFGIIRTRQLAARRRAGAEVLLLSHGQQGPRTTRITRIYGVTGRLNIGRPVVHRQL